MNQVLLLCTCELMCVEILVARVVFHFHFPLFYHHHHLVASWYCIGEILYLTPRSMWLDVCDIHFLQNKCSVPIQEHCL